MCQSRNEVGICRVLDYVLVTNSQRSGDMTCSRHSVSGFYVLLLCVKTTGGSDYVGFATLVFAHTCTPESTHAQICHKVITPKKY